MKNLRLILPVLLFSMLLSHSLSAQQSEYKKLVKAGLTVESLEQFITDFPDFAPAYLKLGDLYDQKEPAKAIENYDVAYGMMSDAETKQNARFYEDYKRRDSRTGKIVLKTDYLKQYIEEKIEDNKEEIE